MMIEKNTVLNEEDKENNSNVIPFKVIEKANAPFDPNEPDWLRQLPQGQAFLCRPKNNTMFLLAQYIVLQKTAKSVILLDTLNQSTEKPFFVDSVRFSRDMQWIENLNDPEKEREHARAIAAQEQRDPDIQE